MAAAAQPALRQHLAFDLIAALGQYFHLQRAVIDQHDVARVDVVDEILVIDIYRTLLFAPFAADRKRELLARLQVERHRQLAGANGGTLRVHHDPDEPLARRRSRADCRHHALHPLVRGVRHVQPEEVYSGVDEPADHFG